MGKTLEVILSELPPTQETIEKIRETVKEMQEDFYISDNLERKRVVKLNIGTCEKRIKAIESKL